MSRQHLCDRAEALRRAAVGTAYLRAALDHPIEQPEDRQVAAGNAVLAAIAAADAICCLRLGKRNSSDRHSDAVGLLAAVSPQGKALARHLQTVLGEKDAVHYGVSLVTESRTKRILRSAEHLVAAAEDMVRSG